MYRITSNGTVIYDARTPIDGFKVINPTLELTDGSAGTLTFTLPSRNRNYNLPIGMASTITVYKNGVEIWEGRIINEEDNFIGDRKFTCEGEMGYLNDTYQPLMPYFEESPRTFLAALIAHHNAKASQDHQFAVGDVTVVDDINYCDYLHTDLSNNTLYYIKDMAEKLKGHVRVQKRNGIRYIDLLAEDYDRQSEQTIDFGRNLLDFTATFDLTDLATVVIPLGAQMDKAEYVDEHGHTQEVADATDYITIEDVNDGKNYVYSAEAVSLYGWIEVTVQFDDIVGDPGDLEKLKQKGQEYLEDCQFQKMVLKCTAVDLYNLGVAIDDIRLRDYVKVVSTQHGMNRYFTVTDVRLDLADPSKSTYTLGKDQQMSLTSRTVGVNNALVRKINNTESIALRNAKKEAAEMIMACTTGNINFVKLEDGSQWKYTPLLPSQLDQAQALIISETDDVDHLTDQDSKFWVWNMNGLMFTKTGGRSAEAAITMDGKIVANFIQAGEMLADRVRGGTFVVGGSLADGDGRDGVILVKNASGAVLVRLDKNGMTLDSSVKIAFGNLSGVPDYQTASQVDSRATQITRDTVTTSYVNALNVKAGSVDAENITGSVITGKTLNGGAVNTTWVVGRGTRQFHIGMVGNAITFWRRIGENNDTAIGMGEIILNDDAYAMQFPDGLMRLTGANVMIEGRLLCGFGPTILPESTASNRPHLDFSQTVYQVGATDHDYDSRIQVDTANAGTFNFTTKLGAAAGQANYAEISVKKVNAQEAESVSSSRVIKENIENISEEDGNKILDIRPVEFDYKTTGKHAQGMIVEEVCKVFPDLVSFPENWDEESYDGDPTSPIPSMNYTGFIPYLIKLCQNQQQQIDALKEEINKLKEVTK